MGIYSVLLSVGPIAGSLLAGLLARAFQIDGLLLGTASLGICGLALLQPVRSGPPLAEGREYEQL